MTIFLRQLDKKTWSFVAVTLLILASLVLVFLTRASSVQAAQSDGERLITIYDKNNQKTIITTQKTVGDALKQAKIALQAHDSVDPSPSTKLSAQSYHINIYRAQPVLVVDGNARQTVMTPYDTPKQIAATAERPLYDEDTTTLSQSDNILDSNGTGLQLTIDRATKFNFVLYGKPIEARSQATTVGAMIKDKNIVLGPDDTVSLPLTTPLSTDLKVEIWRNGKQTINEEQVVAFPVQQIQDADQLVGYKAIKTPGVVGKKNVSFEVEMQNGQEVSRHIIQEVITQQAQTQIEVIGTKVNLPAGSHEDWMAAAGIASGDYGYVNYIVNREGGWEPCKVQGGAINCSYSGSMGYGVVQATPGGKMVSAGSDWRTNPITQLRWATSYAVGRYGSWSGAYNHWQTSHSW